MIRIAIDLFDAQESRKVQQPDPTKGVGPNRLRYKNSCTMTNILVCLILWFNYMGGFIGPKTWCVLYTCAAYNQVYMVM